MIKPQNLLPNLSPRQPLEDEYISETDGLIYCSKCHTPRQKKIEFLGKIMFPIIRSPWLSGRVSCWGIWGYIRYVSNIG